MGSSSPNFRGEHKTYLSCHFLEITSIAYPHEGHGSKPPPSIHHFLNGGWYTFRTNVCRDDPTSRAKKSLPDPKNSQLFRWTNEGSNHGFSDGCGWTNPSQRYFRQIPQEVGMCKWTFWNHHPRMLAMTWTIFGRISRGLHPRGCKPLYWVFPKIGVPPKHPKMIIFSRKTHGCWVPPFWKHPYTLKVVTQSWNSWVEISPDPRDTTMVTNVKGSKCQLPTTFTSSSGATLERSIFYVLFFGDFFRDLFRGLRWVSCDLHLGDPIRVNWKKLVLRVLWFFDWDILLMEDIRPTAKGLKTRKKTTNS